MRMMIRRKIKRRKRRLIQLLTFKLPTVEDA